MHRTLIALLCLTPVATATAADHPISITEANVFVTQNRANVQLHLFAEDLNLFHDLESDNFDVFHADELKRGIEEHKSFLADNFIIRDAAGEVLKGSLVNLQQFEMPEDGIPAGDLMNYKLMYQFEYQFEEPPEFLTFETRLSDPDFLIPSEAKLILKQSGNEAVYTQALKLGEPHTAPRFDWTNPGVGEDATQAEWDAWFEKQRTATLGITSYGSVYSFIYVTDYEVRHEILVPLATLASIFEIKRADESWLEIDEQDAARERVKKYFGTGIPVTIDGVEVQPVFDRIDFYGLNLRDFAQRAPERRVSMASGRIGVIMSYSTKGTPSEVKVQWTQKRYAPSMNKIDATVIAFDEMKKHRFSRFGTNQSNTYTWQNPGLAPRPEISTIVSRLPPKPELTVRPVAWASLGAGGLLFLLFVRKVGGKALIALLLGGGLAAATWSDARQIESPFEQPVPVADTEARQVFETLHRNVYRAFDYGVEDEVYDALDASVSGELLKDVYLDVRKSLVVREEGGAAARIREVEYIDGERVAGEPPLAWPNFRFRSTWQVSGTIEHWGHIHERVNEFEGIFTVTLEGSDWKLTEFEIVGEKRVKSKTRPRKF